MNFYRNVIRRDFANGLRLYVLPFPTRSVELQCFVDTGSVNEGKFLGCGLSHFLEHMLFQGCRNYPGTAAADTIDRLGGSMNAYTSCDHTVYHLRIAGRHLETGVDVLSSMVRYPEFPEARFASERDVILRELDLSRDKPEGRINEVMMRELFLSHPIRVPIIGRRELIAAVSRDMMAEYYRLRYTPCRTFFVAVGEVDADRLAEMLEKRLGDWPAANLAEEALPVEAIQSCRRESEFIFPDPLARLALAVKTPGASHPDLPALEVLAGILAMGDGSRLVRVLELEQELAVHVRSFCYAIRSCGTLGIWATVTPDKLVRLERALLAELDVIRRGGLSQAEVAREKEQQLAEHLRKLRNPGDIAAQIGGGVLDGGSPEFDDVYLANLKRLTRDDLVRVAGEYLNPDRFTLVRQLSGEGRGAKRKVRRETAPAGLTPESATLTNGSPLLIVADRKLPLVDAVIVIPGGTIFETSEVGGASGLAADLLTAGTKRLSETEVLNRLDRYGASLNITGGLNSMVIELSVPRSHSKAALGLLEDILTEPLFAAAPFERERRNRLEELASSLQSPSGAANERLRKLMFPGHPYGWGSSGTREQLAGLTPEAVAGFYRGCWRPGQVLFGFGGDCRPEEALEWGNRLAARIDWQAGKRELPALPAFPKAATEAVIALNREQTAVFRALPGPALTHPAFEAFEIFGQAMNGLSSRLFKVIREDNALAYTTGMRFTGGFHPGWLLFYAITSPEQARRAEELLVAEAAAIAAEGLREEEFAAARESAAFAASQAVESVGPALTGSLLAMHYGRSPRSVWEHEEELRAIDAEALHRATRPYLENPAAVTVFAGRQLVEKRS